MCASYMLIVQLLRLLFSQSQRYLTTFRRLYCWQAIRDSFSICPQPTTHQGLILRVLAAKASDDKGINSDVSETLGIHGEPH